MATDAVRPTVADAPVLVVDDDPAIRKLLDRAFRAAGFEVLLAEDGATALELFGAEPVSAVLLDSHMPGMNGHDVLNAIRAAPGGTTVPVLFVTVSDDLDERVDGFEAGADDYVTKPFELAELIARVRSHIRRNDAWSSSVTDLERRLDAVVLLRSIRLGTDAESIAASACVELMGHDRVVGVGVVAFNGPHAATPLAGAGMWEDWLAVGEPLGTKLARTLIRDIASGPTIVRASSKPNADPLDADMPQSTRQYDIAMAPIFGQIDTLGMLAIATEPEEAPGRGNTTLASAIDFAAVLSALLGPELDNQATTERARAELQDLIDTKAFTPTFQPVVNIESGEVVGVEALTRWDDGIRPDLRFGEAHALDLGIEAEIAVIIEILRAVPPSMPDDLWLSINVSPRLVLSGALDDILEGISRKIVLELTEHEEVDDYDALGEALNRHPECSVAVDDAGAGYASMRHVLNLKPDFVKLDINWVRNVDTDVARQALMTAMVGFATQMGMTVIAEGVETDAERKTLTSIGVELGQGFLYSLPTVGSEVPFGVLLPDPSRVPTRRSPTA